MSKLFVFNPHSIVDTITNSSTELFVGTNMTKETLESLIKSVYPNYLDEYYSLVSIDDISDDDFETYIYYQCHSWRYPAKKEDYRLLPNFTFDEIYEKNEKDVWDPYKVREGFCCKETRDKLSPNKDMFFLFSIDDNPDWEMQEELSSFMQRIHLG